MSGGNSGSAAAGQQIVAGLIALGASDFVVSPGSRSQALALSAAAAERQQLARLHTKIDERSGGFFALGIAKELGVPAPVITTSGTAVGNLLPAVMEAANARVPMLLLTADRPPELHGVRANQTVPQAGLFRDFARETFDFDVPCDFLIGDEVSRELARVLRRAWIASLGTPGGKPPGPVQLNIRLRDPLSAADQSVSAVLQQVKQLLAAEEENGGAEATAEPSGAGAAGVAESVAGAGDAAEAVESAELDTFVLADNRLTVAFAGSGAGAAAEQFAHEAGVPLLAEVVSGSRYGREAISCYKTLLEGELGEMIERVVVFGHPTLTRNIGQLLRRSDIEVVVVDPHRGERYNPGGTARFAAAATVAEDYDPGWLRQWLGAWVVADRELREARTTVHSPDLVAARATGYKERNRYARAELAVKREPVTRELLTDTVWRASWPHDRLVIAASRLVRTLDGIAAPRPVRVYANRGVAGIDGTIATALGIAAASQAAPDVTQAAGVTRVIIGDLALLHDVGSLLLGDDEELRVQIIVGNDAGGTIFDQLEVAETAHQADFERVMRTPQRVQFEQLAAAYGWQYELARNRGELEKLFTVPVTGPMIIEVPLA